MKKLTLTMALAMLLAGMGHAQNGDKLVKANEERFVGHAQKVKQADYNNMVTWAKEVFRNYCADEANQVDFDAEALRLKADSVEFYKSELMQQEDRNQQADAEKKALETEKARLERTNDSLVGEIDKTARAVEGYRKAFDNIEKEVDQVYEANQTKAFGDMDLDAIERARANFVNMEVLLKTDTSLHGRLYSKINEMEAWKAIVAALRAGREYLQGKYDNNKRTKYINAINAAKKDLDLTEAQQKEAAEMLDDLANQAEVQKECVNLIAHLLDPNEGVYVLASAQDAETALKAVGKTKEKLAEKLTDRHVKHKQALDELQEMFEQAKKDISKNRLNVPVGFEAAMNKTKKVFQ